VRRPMAAAVLCLFAAGAVRLPPLSRRAAVLGFSASQAGVLLPARAATQQPAGAAAQQSLMSIMDATRSAPDGTRFSTSLIARPAYGLETPDVYYPEWAYGRWKVSSTLTSVQAPMGNELFAPRRNGTAALLQARTEIGQPLLYEARWRRNDDGTVVVDRPFCVESISRASMGKSAVDNSEEDGPDRLVMYLTPPGAKGAVYRADLRVVARRTDAQRTPESFECAETTRQTVVLAPSPNSGRVAQPPPLVKEVETICTYSLISKDVIRAEQRTATFLVGDAVYTGDQSFAEQQAVRMSRRDDGTMLAVDLRHYSLTYERAV